MKIIRKSNCLHDYDGSYKNAVLALRDKNWSEASLPSVEDHFKNDESFDQDKLDEDFVQYATEVSVLNELIIQYNQAIEERDISNALGFLIGIEEILEKKQAA